MTEVRRFIPVAKPSVGEAEAGAARRAILSGWLTQGPEVASFEREFAEFVGAPFGCAVANCTVALHLALKAVGVTSGDEVITVSHSFIATANSIRYCGAVPVFIDIQPDTFNLDPLLLEQAITDRTRAILAVHQLGMPCDLTAIVTSARRHGLPVIEDAACAAGSEIYYHGNWEKLGKPHGDIACFSFHPRKLLTTGDGGMLTTANATWDKQFRAWRQHSMNIPDTARHEADRVVFESYEELGFNFRLTDVQASIGREQINRVPGLVQRRRKQVERYRRVLAEIPGLVCPNEPDWARSNWQSFCIRLPAGCSQRQVMQTLLDAGVATRRGVMCAHREPAYRVEPWSCGSGPGGCGCPPSSCRRLAESERAQDESIILPLFEEMSDQDMDLVAESLRRALSQPTTAAPVL